MIHKYNIDISHFKSLKNTTNDGYSQVCSKCKIRKPVSEFYKRKRNATGIMSICKQCCTSTYGRGRAKKDKLYWIKYLGGKCNRCGILADELNYVIFDFHHIDPTTKEYSPQVIYRYGRETAKKELDKCILLCSNCHRIIHHQLNLKQNEKR